MNSYTCVYGGVDKKKRSRRDKSIEKKFQTFKEGDNQSKFLLLINMVGGGGGGPMESLEKRNFFFWVDFDCSKLVTLFSRFAPTTSTTTMTNNFIRKKLSFLFLLFELEITESRGKNLDFRNK